MVNLAVAASRSSPRRYADHVGALEAKFPMGICMLDKVFVENFATGCPRLDIIEE